MVPRNLLGVLIFPKPSQKVALQGFRPNPKIPGLPLGPVGPAWPGRISREPAGRAGPSNSRSGPENLAGRPAGSSSRATSGVPALQPQWCLPSAQVVVITSQRTVRNANAVKVPTWLEERKVQCILAVSAPGTLKRNTTLSLTSGRSMFQTLGPKWVVDRGPTSRMWTPRPKA